MHSPTEYPLSALFVAAAIGAILLGLVGYVIGRIHESRLRMRTMAEDLRGKRLS